MEKKKTDITKCYSKHVLSVPCPFVALRFLLCKVILQASSKSNTIWLRFQECVYCNMLYLQIYVVVLDSNASDIFRVLMEQTAPLVFLDALA